MECVICLDDISSNEYSKFDCCNNSSHNSCLHSWIVKNIDNKNIHKCFICSQDNSAIKNIIFHIFVFLLTDSFSAQKSYKLLK